MWVLWRPLEPTKKYHSSYACSECLFVHEISKSSYIPDCIQWSCKWSFSNCGAVYSSMWKSQKCLRKMYLNLHQKPLFVLVHNTFTCCDALFTVDDDDEGVRLCLWTAAASAPIVRNFAENVRNCSTHIF